MSDQWGKICTACGMGRYVVFSTRIEGQYRIRYLWCPNCRAKPDPNKLVVPLQYAPKRPKIKMRRVR